MPKYLHWQSHFSASPPPVTCRPLKSQADKNPKRPQISAPTKPKFEHGATDLTFIVIMLQHYIDSGKRAARFERSAR